MRKFLFFLIFISSLCASSIKAQINTDRMTIIGRNALYFEDYILAIQYFNQVIMAKPYLSDPYYYRAVGKYNLDDLKGAEQDVSKALDINPYYVDAYNLRGIVRQRLGKTSEAISDFERGLRIEPENINLIINIGIGHLYNKHYDKAIATYSQAIKISPNLVSAWLNRGHAKVASSDTIGGLDDFTKAIKINPYIPDGYSNRAIVYYQLSEFDKSLTDLNKAIEIRPDDARFYMNRGIIRYQLDDLKGTVDDFDKVIELEPRNAMAYGNRGILRAQVGDTNRAIEDFSRVLALQPDDMLTLYNRAMLYMETGEWRRALADLNIIADEYPDFAQVFFARSQAKKMTGDNRGAELDYGTAVKLEMGRREQSDKELASSSTKNNKENKVEGERKATRRESDKDIRNHNKIAVLDDFGNEQPDEMGSNPLRGRIQNRNIVIDMEQYFGLTYFPGDTLVHRLRYFNIDIDAFNRQRLTNRVLKIANVEQEPNKEDAVLIFENINSLSNQLKNAKDKEKVSILFARAALYNTVVNLNNALDDYNRIIEIEPNNYLAWFNKAYTRYKMIDLIKSIESETPAAPQPLRIGSVGIRQSQQQEGERRILDYDVIKNDLNKAIQINPRFAFAHFNLGMIEALTHNFTDAVTHFSKAIEINPEMAEAWFNRGLTRIFLEDEVAGTLDLSKAGELGIFKAYNVIKRYGAASAVEYDDENQEK